VLDAARHIGPRAVLLQGQIGLNKQKQKFVIK
jgi:hypothetical protein